VLAGWCTSGRRAKGGTGLLSWARLVVLAGAGPTGQVGLDFCSSACPGAFPGSGEVMFWVGEKRLDSAVEVGDSLGHVGSRCWVGRSRAFQSTARRPTTSRAVQSDREGGGQ